MTKQHSTFNNLTINQLYQILALRSEVFVVEQDCVYQDIDGCDQQAIHVLFNQNDTLVAYARILPPKTYFEQLSIGRVIVKETYRGTNLGHKLMTYALQLCNTTYPEERIKISAQQHLTNFYKQHGFTAVGEGYLEDGIPHIAMITDA